MKHSATILLTIIFLLPGQRSSGQTDTLNKFNASGKKTGYWKVLVNENVDPVDSLKDACFYGIELWDDGFDVFNFEKHKWKYDKVTFDGTLPEKGKPELIDGTFRWYDENGLLINEDVYRAGQPERIKSFVYSGKTDTIPEIFEDIDFTKRYNDIPGTFFYREFDKEFWFRKGDKGWECYEIQKE